MQELITTYRTRFFDSEGVWEIPSYIAKDSFNEEHTLICVFEPLGNFTRANIFVTDKNVGMQPVEQVCEMLRELPEFQVEEEEDHILNHLYTSSLVEVDFSRLEIFEGDGKCKSCFYEINVGTYEHMRLASEWVEHGETKVETAYLMAPNADEYRFDTKEYYKHLESVIKAQGLFGVTSEIEVGVSNKGLIEQVYIDDPMNRREGRDTQPLGYFDFSIA